MTNIIIVLTILFTGVTATGFDNEIIAREMNPLAHKLSVVTGHTKEEVLEKTFGELHFQRLQPENDTYSCWSSLVCYGDPFSSDKSRGLLIHELGHRFLNDLNLPYSEMNMDLGYYENGSYVHISGINPQTGKFERTARGYPHAGQPYEQHGGLSPNYNTFKEDFADMFMNWVLGTFQNDTAGNIRNDWIDGFIREHLSYSSKVIMLESLLK